MMFLLQSSLGRRLLVLEVLVCASHLSSCLESPQPEVLLQPRNFNPHPYQEGVRLSPTVASRLGPVLFPEGVDPTITRQSALPVRLFDTGVDNHPYANVARKHRIKLAGRFSSIAADQDNIINPQVYHGLANYAAKVLKKPIADRRNTDYDDDITLSGQKKDYAFSYAVRDHATGDDFSHRQQQDSKATHGEYRVKLPDGRIQIVSYTADKNGYKADVKYADDVPEGDSNPKQPTAAAVVPVPAAPVAPVAPTPQEYDYNYGQQSYASHGQTVSGNPLTQIEIPLYEDNQQTYQIGTVNPKYYQNGQKYVTLYPVLDELQKHSQQYVPEDKVQIYPQGEQKLDVSAVDLPHHGTNIQSVHTQQVQPQYDGKLLNIGGATLVPYTDGHILKGYGGNILVSTVAPEQYSRERQVYVTTPRYNVIPPNQHYYNQ